MLLIVKPMLTEGTCQDHTTNEGPTMEMEARFLHVQSVCLQFQKSSYHLLKT